MNKSLEQYMPDGSKLPYRFMKYRIHKILLVCCSYDGYILEEDGHIESQINQEYIDLNMSNPPSLTRVSSTAEALEALDRDDSFDFILTMYNVGEPDVFSFAKIVKERHPNTPVALLTSFSKDIYRRIEEQDRSGLDYIFSWHGNTELIIAIIKLIEDKMNADEDIREGGVQAILLVEDSIRFYSTYLPEIYKLLLLQNTEFLKDAFNEQQQVLRKRARPKILLARCYEEAVELYERYKKNLLGVISDVGFVLRRNDPPESEKLDAGIDLCRRIREDNPLMPVLLQSSQTEFEAQARGAGCGIHRQELQDAALAAARLHRQRVRLRRLRFQGPRHGCRDRPREGPDADAADDRHDPRPGVRIPHLAESPLEMALLAGTVPAGVVDPPV